MKTSLLLIILMSFLLVDCRSKPPKHPAPTPNDQASAANAPESSISIEAQQLAAEQETKFVTEINFKKGSTEIFPAGKKEIRELIKKADQDGNIYLIKLVTWGDLEYPSVHTEKLSDKEQKLVDDRNAALEKFIKSINGDFEVEKVSMAERPGWLKRMISSDEAKIKKSLETGGIPNTDTSVKTPTKASKSIIIVTLEELN